LTVPGRGPDKQDCLSARALARWPDALVVHRLDQATSGLVVMARSPAAQRDLSAAFAQREVLKRYVAVVSGKPALTAGEIALPLLADWPHRPKQMVDMQHGKPSLTRYWVVEDEPSASGCTNSEATPHAPVTSRLALEPLTGRTHQLRVHLWALGHPILGDMLYAPPEVQQQSSRLMLHAEFLRLPHPATGEPLSFESAAPF
jgi:tRNA pseudouridine32 synthase / 23S rRNA pseudouridine746 synthase